MDKKNVFIIVLGIALVLSFIFRPSKEVDTYEDEINALRMENKSLHQSNDSLTALNIALGQEIKDLLTDIDSVQAELVDTEDKINSLNNGKDKVSSYVNTLNADGVADALTEYLDKRK